MNSRSKIYLTFFFNWHQYITDNIWYTVWLLVYTIVRQQRDTQAFENCNWCKFLPMIIFFFKCLHSGSEYEEFFGGELNFWHQKINSNLMLLWYHNKTTKYFAYFKTKFGKLCLLMLKWLLNSILAHEFCQMHKLALVLAVQSVDIHGFDRQWYWWTAIFFFFSCQSQPFLI